MNRVRAGLIVLGTIVIGYGGWLLVSRQDPDRVLHAAVWLAGGVVVHDALLAPLALACGALGIRRLPKAARVPTVVGCVAFAPLTLLAIPVLGRFGAREDNPSLLDRPYLEAWAVLALLTLLAVGIATAVRSRRRRGE